MWTMVVELDSALSTLTFLLSYLTAV
jgi:hypothetical protein